ncbi:MAG: hypothetical protein HYV92_00260 [Candidatus Rokubacteria bacterium]|nr:hypothetical protein [Candidatus Rokubacteria bacterium]MBI2552882.1 hypothetical protein [Candidatus Rokubacteria bacterium]
MIPRGEVRLIFAGIGLANRVVEQELYSALVTMIMVSTFGGRNTQRRRRAMPPRLANC